LARLQRENEPLPETLEATSGRSHRRHLYFRYPDDGTKIGRHIKINGAALDVLGDGGYVVAPPSIHPKTGKPYRWLNDREIAPLPDWLIAVCAARAAPGRPRMATVVGEVIPEGSRDVMLTSLAGSMRRRGF